MYRSPIDQQTYSSQESILRQLQEENADLRNRVASLEQEANETGFAINELAIKLRELNARLQDAYQQLARTTAESTLLSEDLTAAYAYIRLLLAQIHTLQNPPATNLGDGSTVTMENSDTFSP